MSASAVPGLRNPLPLGALPASARATLARIGPVWGSDIRAHRDLVWGAYEPLLAACPTEGVERLTDLSYGKHPRQVLDVYRERTATGRRPVVVFMHGGAFVRGDRNVNDHAYGNVLAWFVRHGYVGVNLEYRLAPEAPYPGGAQDLAAAVRWLRDNIAAYGGDPASIFLFGHSAGGTHVASYVFDPVLGFAGAGVRAIALVSARLRADVRPENPNASGVAAYFGADATLHDVRSPVSHAHTSAMPTFIAFAEFENPLLDVYAAEMHWRLAAARGKGGPLLRLAGHNHISIVAHFNTEEEILGREMLEFFAAA